MRHLWKLKIAFLLLLAATAMTALVMWLWNWLIPDLFSGPVISFWQALGLMLLSKILFRGIFGMKGRGLHQMGPWKARYDKMSPEQKERVRELWKKRCGGFTCDDKESKKES